MTYGELIQQSLYKLSMKNKHDFSLSNMKEKFPDLSHQEIRLLVTIFVSSTRNEKISASYLAKTYGVTTAAIMHKLEILEDCGYIIRKQDEMDKRIKYIEISDKLKECTSDLKTYNDKNIENIVKVLGDEDSKTLIRILNKLIDSKEI